MDTSKVTRVEIIDHTKPVDKGGGRVYGLYTEASSRVELQLQDDGRTLKVFISSPSGRGDS